MDKLEQHIESVIFSSEQPISLKEIKNCLEQSMEAKLKKGLLEEAMQNLLEKYQGEEFAFEIIEISGGYQFLTKGAYHHTIGTLLKQKAKKRLSKAALETLAIIAYKQPVTKSEAEAIRGVSCDYSIQKLLEKELITIVGRSEGPGRPLLYATSEKFMNYFGLKSIQDLPKLKEFATEENTIGEAAAIDETIETKEANSETEEAAEDKYTQEEQELIIGEINEMVQEEISVPENDVVSIEETQEDINKTNDHEEEQP